jgi:hypothetical protein
VGGLRCVRGQAARWIRPTVVGSVDSMVWRKFEALAQPSSPSDSRNRVHHSHSRPQPHQADSHRGHQARQPVGAGPTVRGDTTVSLNSRSPPSSPLLADTAAGSGCPTSCTCSVAPDGYSTRSAAIWGWSDRRRVPDGGSRHRDGRSGRSWPGGDGLMEPLWLKQPM